jgi:ribosomal protein S18 acetylase RimI-like enzyme
MVTVREATEADAQVLSELNNEFNGVRRSPEEIRQQMRTAGSSETILVVEELGSTIGFLCFQALRSVCFEPPWVELTELYVVPPRRGHGAGRALLEEAARRAVAAGASELVLRTNVRNAAAQHLFARGGFEAAPHIVYRRVLRGAT